MRHSRFTKHLARAASLMCLLVLMQACTQDLGVTRSRANGDVGAVFDRVLASGVLRVGYVSYAPGTIVNPETRQIGGIFPELFRRLATNAGLEVQFVEETTYATLIEGLTTGKYDIVGGVWANPNRAKAATLSAPVYFSPVEVWVRAGDKRFDVSRGFSGLNDPSVRIGAIDGSTPLGITRAEFPNATLQTYPNVVQESQLFMDLSQGRIDVFFAEPTQAALFTRSNPGKIERLSGPRPLRTFANVFVMPPNEPQMKVFIDNAILDLQTSGVVDQLLSQFEGAAGALLRPAVPYRN